MDKFAIPRRAGTTIPRRSIAPTRKMRRRAIVLHEGEADAIERRAIRTLVRE